MIEFERFELENGLTFIFHKDKSTPLAVVNLLYKVGAVDEDPERTGFAHLFEHLMFGGSVNIPDFDPPLQRAGGENNAFTSNDLTNYYEVLPAENIETALWLESDRMLSLAFTDKSLEVQRNVVIEEFKQRYLNQPYGDVWLHLRPLAYQQHPYNWATIGKELKHIEDAGMEEVKAFFKRYYCPANAILCVAGNFETDHIKTLVEKWFGAIPSGLRNERNLPVEPEQEDYRELELSQKVPGDAFYYAFKMVDRLHKDYHCTDMISDILGHDKSSRLYNKLKKELEIASEISCYITGSLYPGLLVISGKIAAGKTFKALDEALWKELNQMTNEIMPESELERIKMKIRTSKEFQDQGLMNRAMNLCFHELFGDAGQINFEQERYKNVLAEDIRRVAQSILRKENCSLLKIKASNA